MNIFRFSLAVCLLLLFSFQAEGQTIPIHDPNTHQKAAYVGTPTTVDPTGAIWPFLSAQAHWGPANDMAFNGDSSLLNPTVGHVHIECNAPIWGEITTVIGLPCQLQLFHISGFIAAAFSRYGNGHFIWTATGAEQRDPYDVPVMRGNPMGIVKFPFMLWIDLEQWRTTTPHGWTGIQITTRMKLDNQSQFDSSLFLPFYSMIDSTSPECDGCVSGLSSSMTPFSSTSPAGWGTMVVETRNILPILAPIQPAMASYWDQPFFNGYTYVDSDGPGGITLARVDIDLHNGSEGRPIEFGHFNSADIGSGTHKVAMIWKEDVGNGVGNFTPHDVAAVLLVTTVTVGPVVDPPPTCQDPTATNVGGPLPCVFVQPPPDWQTITGVLQRLNDQIRLLLPDGKVLNLGTAVAP